MIADLVQIVGVRHHSPACARVVAAAIEERKPRHVLIEGPSDMNARIDELFLKHTLPIAVFTYLRAGRRSRGLWSPFCVHSPEWVALQQAHGIGAEPRFMDLPAWHPVFHAVENRYADHRGDQERTRAERYLDRLCATFRLDDGDTLWDHLFELDMKPEAVRFDVHFDALRSGEAAGKRDGPREAFMLRCLAWAARDAEARGGTADKGGVVAVCGGWHRPALIEGLRAAIERNADDTYPEPPGPFEDAEEEDAQSDDDADLDDADPDAAPQWGSYLVPYSHRRLDSLAGYASGMPSPGYYEHVWRDGPQRAAELAMVRIAGRLRGKKQPVSTADLIACRTTAEALARIRGHAVIARGDLLDAVAATFVKDALDVEVPWARRGVLREGTHPILVEVVAELAGTAMGRLAANTPRPPLSGDVDKRLAAAGIALEAESQKLTLQLRSPPDLAKSRVLHRLRVLAIPGFERIEGPAWATDAQMKEVWEIHRALDADAALVQAASYGATLEAAAKARLAERCMAGSGAAALADAIGDAILAGLLRFAADTLARLERAIREENHLAEIGVVLARVHALHQHGALLLGAGDETLAVVIAAAFDRGLWLLEGLAGGAGFEAENIEAVAALRDVAVASASPHRPAIAAVSVARAAAVFERRLADFGAPPSIRGACLGAVVTLSADPSVDLAGVESLSSSDALAAVRRSPPRDLGDLLAGLFALAREAMLEDPDLVRTVDTLLVQTTEDDFLAALPALRFAFDWFPPRERGTLAERAAALHGVGPAGAAKLLRPVAAPEAVQEARRVERGAAETAARFGLGDELDRERAS